MLQRVLKSLMCVTVLATAIPSLAQDTRQVERRIDKLESEMRAVQRKVFPGGDKRYFEPEFQPTEQAPVAPTGVPATSPIADLTTRVDALERQLQSLTGQVEQANYKVRQMEDAMAKFRADAEFRLTQLEGGVKPPATATDETATSLPVLTPPANATTVPAKPADAAKPAATTPKPAADAATKPTDPVEAAYQAAYLNYSNQQYAKAETALAEFVAKNPRSRRASHAQYWLGRTYMAQKLPAQAAKAFLDNYRNMPKGERAPDSLYWLGQALMAMSPPQPARACEVYDELRGAYADKLSTSLKGQVDKARATAKCS
jgi:tol-pal system protein YbgF